MAFNGRREKDFTLKQWPVEYFQDVVAHFRGRLSLSKSATANSDHHPLDA